MDTSGRKGSDMNIFSLFTLCGGLAFFLYGMTVLVGVQLVLVGQDLLLPVAVILNELGQSQLHAFQRQSAHAGS